MRTITNEIDMIALGRAELEAIRKSEFDRGYAEGLAAARQETQTKARARARSKVKDENGNAVEFRAAVVEPDDGE